MGNLGETMKKIILSLLSFSCFTGSLSGAQSDTSLTPTQVNELKNQVCNVRPALEGWCTEEKALQLVDLVLEIEPQVCVDIGVFGGSSLFPIALSLKYLNQGIVFGIDPWDKLECIRYYDPLNKKDQENCAWWGNLDLNRVYKSYLENLRRFGLESYCTTLKLTSEKAASAIPPIDLLHIDGNHSALVFTQDVRLYLPKVRAGGYILLNDALCVEAQQAIDLLLESCDAIKTIDYGNCVIFKKR
jgi:hypothetical protein